MSKGEASVLSQLTKKKPETNNAKLSRSINLQPRNSNSWELDNCNSPRKSEWTSITTKTVTSNSRKATEETTTSRRCRRVSGRQSISEVVSLRLRGRRKTARAGHQPSPRWLSRSLPRSHLQANDHRWKIQASHRNSRERALHLRQDLLRSQSWRNQSRTPALPNRSFKSLTKWSSSFQLCLAQIQ